MSESMEASKTRAELEALDQKYLWHPFTPQSSYPEDAPLIVERAEGHYLIDVDGTRYLDGVGSLWCNTFGHRRSEIDEAIRAQLNRVAHATLLGNASVPAIELAQRLGELAPDPLCKVFFSDNGSTAAEVALKMALQYWQQVPGGEKRRRFLGLTEAYSGDTVGAVSIGGVDLFHRRFGPMLFQTVRAPSPCAYLRGPTQSREAYEAESLERFERIFLEHKDELAAVMLEPGFQGAGGILTYPPGYIQKIAQLVRAHGPLLIFDEVAVGMGRSGHMFAAEREGVTPDLLCIAKGLTGGYLPVAATLATQAIYDAFLGPAHLGRTFFHGHTYTGNALGCAAALATLDIFEREQILRSLPAKIEHLRAQLTKLEGRQGVAEVRQYGLAVGVQLAKDQARTPFDPALRVGMRVCTQARKKGVFLRPLSDVIVLMPPLTIELGELDRLVEAIDFGLTQALASLP